MHPPALERGHVSLMDPAQFTCQSTDVLDGDTGKTLDIGGLAETIGQECVTNTGRLFLNHRLHNPMSTPEDIAQHQEALEELRNDTRLRDDLLGFLQRVKYDGSRDREDAVNHSLRLGYQMNPKRFNSTRQLLSELPGIMEGAKKAESAYLRSLQDGITQFDGTRAHELSAKPFYKKVGGEVMAQSETSWSTPALGYRPVLGPLSTSIGFAGMVIGAAIIVPPVAVSTGIYCAPGPALGAFLQGSIQQDRRCKALQDCLRDDPYVNSALEAVAGIDELLAKHSFGMRLGEYATLAEPMEGKHHAFEAYGLVDAQRYLKNPDEETPRDVTVSGGSVSVTDSCGEAFPAALTAQKAQVLHQAGSYVPARDASMVLVERMSYKVLASSDSCSFNVVQR